MPAILFGSISTIADTSELQREAFNRAFAEHGLDWEWGREDYLAMLESNGGRDRVAEFAASRGDDVDADAVHRTKSEIFRTSLAGADLAPRAGVAETVRRARERDLSVALVTTTSPENVTALAGALAGQLDLDGFDLLVDSSHVASGKPDPEAYAVALRALDVAPDTCVAIEDNLGGVTSAQAAGVACVAFPNANTAAHDFSAARARRDRIDLDDLQSFLP